MKNIVSLPLRCREKQITFRFATALPILLFVNSTMPCQEEIVRLMVTYLEQEDDEVRKELYEVVTSDILLGIFHALARVARVRRKLNRSKCA